MSVETEPQYGRVALAVLADESDPDRLKGWASADL
jgi:hypothetical protein